MYSVIIYFYCTQQPRCTAVKCNLQGYRRDQPLNICFSGMSREMFPAQPSPLGKELVAVTRCACSPRFYGSRAPLPRRTCLPLSPSGDPRCPPVAEHLQLACFLPPSCAASQSQVPRSHEANAAFPIIMLSRFDATTSELHKHMLLKVHMFWGGERRIAIAQTHHLHFNVNR